MSSIRFLAARSVLGSVVVLWLAFAPAASARSQDTAVAWSWRELGTQGWGAWRAVSSGPAMGEAPAKPADLMRELRIQPAPDARAVEMRARELREDGERRQLTLWEPTFARPSLPRKPAPEGDGKRALSSVQGRLLYLDRIFDLSGYSGAARRLPLRQVAIELVRSSDDSLMVSGSTEADGFFLLEYDALEPEDLQLRILSRVEGHSGRAPQVWDSAGPAGELDAASPVIYEVLEIIGMGPSTVLDIGENELQPTGAGDTLAAFNLLDTLLDLSQMLAGSDWLGAAPDSLPPLIWSPSLVQLTTEYADGVVRVASPGAGDDDSWADAVVLAAIGKWYLDRYSRVDIVAASSGLDLANDPRQAYREAASMVLAGLVRQNRALTRTDADGLPVDASITAHVDLGFPPPLGFPGLAQDGVDLETRELSFGGLAQPRGQSSIANAAAMLWDLVDDELSPDGMVGDDDPRSSAGVGSARFHLHASASLPVLPPGEAITYEDFHDAWALAHGEASALDSIAVTVGRTALFVDALEDDSDPLLVAPEPPWVQPAPQMVGGIVLSELYLGDRDWVELSNTGMLPVLLEGWRVVSRRNGFSSGSNRETVIPAGVTLAGGRSLVLFEGGLAQHNDGLALHDPNWELPWREEADGACILYDDGGTAIDFVRWDSQSEPSSEPVPPGLVFSGALDSPFFAHSLSRDSLATDHDQALDFVEALPTPYTPNAPFLRLRSLRPATELDHLRASVTAGGEIRVLALTERESPRPSISLLDALGEPFLVRGPRPGDSGSAILSWTPVVDEDRGLRLSQDAAPLIASALRFGSWLPWGSDALPPVQDFMATALLRDPLSDDVQLSWTNVFPYDELRLYVDGMLFDTLPGSSEEFLLVLGAGHHRFLLEPVQNAVVGERAESAVFVGVTPRFRETGFEIVDAAIFDSQGFFEVEEATVSGRALLDHADPAELYPPDDEAIAELRDPVDLTSDSILRFRHAAHLANDGDRGWVEISANDDLSWQALAEYRGTDHVGGADPADWTDLVLVPGDWVEEELDLSTYAGTRARIRFRRVSDATEERLGWMLDDVFFGTPEDALVWVSPGGHDLFGCGHEERPFASIAQGFANAVYADTLRLAPGTYSETSTVDLDGSPRSVNLAPPLGVSVRGAGVGQSVVLIPGLGTGVYFGPLTGWTASDSALVAGLTLSGGSRGLRVDDASVAAEDLHLDGIGTGVLVAGGELRADRILIEANGRALRQAGGRLVLSHATVTLSERAILVESTVESTRVENSIFYRIFDSVLEVKASAPAPVIACNDFFAFTGAHEEFVGIGNPVGSDGNVALLPQFCDHLQGDYSLAHDSPLLDLAGCGSVGAFGEGCALTAVDALPSLGTTRLLGNFPNPFNPRTRIRFVLAQAGPVSMRLFDLRGRLVRELLVAELSAGEHAVDWDATDAHGRRVASGVYHLELTADGKRHTAAMALLK